MFVICTNFSNCSLMCTKVDRIPSFNSPEETETLTYSMTYNYYAHTYLSYKLLSTFCVELHKEQLEQEWSSLYALHHL